jgi:cation transport regulator ChaC
MAAHGAAAPAAAAACAASSCAASLAACEAALARHFAPAIAECRAGGGVWLFGFASLMWRMEGTPTRAEHAALGGWVRRFYQASPDHRGEPTRMGRVATIVPVPRGAAACAAPAAAAAAAACPLTAAALQQWLADDAGSGGGAASSPVTLAEGEAPVTHGKAYRLEGAAAAEHLATLCRREAGGYEAHRVRCVLAGGEVVEAHTFVGPAAGEFFCPDTPQRLARIICSARGTSGENLDYLLLCKQALGSMGAADVSLDALVALALALKEGATEGARAC